MTPMLSGLGDQENDGEAPDLERSSKFAYIFILKSSVHLCPVQHWFFIFVLDDPNTIFRSWETSRTTVKRLLKYILNLILCTSVHQLFYLCTLWPYALRSGRPVERRWSTRSSGWGPSSTSSSRSENISRTGGDDISLVCLNKLKLKFFCCCC